MRPDSPFSRMLGRIQPQYRALLPLALLPVFKWLYTAPRASVAAYGVDGGYYLDIAQNVSEGLGLLTDVSPFNQGLARLPHPTPVYPLWPLVLGWVGKLVPVELAAFWLPALFFFVALALAWKLGRMWSGERKLEGFGLEVHGGHVLVALFVFNFRFYESTSMPYSEGLAFTLLFIALLRVHPMLESAGSWSVRRALLAGAECGAWCAILFLVRSQLLLFALALVVVLPLLVRSTGWIAATAFGVAAAAAATAVFAPEAVFLGGLSSEWFGGYLRFDQFQATSHLPRLRPDLVVDGPVAFLLDRLDGVLTSLVPGGHDSYSRGFQALAYAPVAYLGFLAVRPAMLRQKVSGFLELCRTRPSAVLPWMFVLSFALGAVVSLHNIHLRLWHAWHFGQRQALVAGFLFFFCWLGLLDFGKTGRRVAAVLLLASFVLGARVVVRNSVDFHRSPGSFVTRHSRVVDWIQSQSTKGGSRRTVWVVPADWGKMFAPVTSGAAYHEYQADAGRRDLDAFFDNLGGELLVIDKGTLPAEVEAAIGSDGRFVRVHEIGSVRFFRYARAGSTGGRSGDPVLDLAKPPVGVLE